MSIRKLTDGTIEADTSEELAQYEFETKRLTAPVLKATSFTRMSDERCARCTHTLEEHLANLWMCDCPACPWKLKKASDYIPDSDGQPRRIATPEEHGVLDYNSLKKAHEP